MWANYPEIKDELILVEESISESVKSKNKLLEEAVGSLVRAGGKRLRPAFVILASKFGRYNRRKIIPVASAVEILHTATLVHDDVIDRTKLRRGKITVSEKFGVDMAVYTGDFLYTKAVLMLSGNLPVDKLALVAKGIKMICEGEVDQYQDKYNINISVFTYLKRIIRKTAVLFSAACSLGADISGCSNRVSRKLSRFGLYYGIAFQIKDDIDNFVQLKDVLGKPVGNDIAEGVVTLPAIMGIRKKDSIRKSLYEFMNKKGNVTIEELNNITEMIKDSGGIDESISLLNRYIERGLKVLGELPHSKYRKVFENIITDLKMS
ncbi:MAG: polyprenyl synthetase family protein [Bacillota bacterium]